MPMFLLTEGTMSLSVSSSALTSSASVLFFSAVAVTMSKDEPRAYAKYSYTGNTKTIITTRI